MKENIYLIMALVVFMSGMIYIVKMFHDDSKIA